MKLKHFLLVGLLLALGFMMYQPNSDGRVPRDMLAPPSEWVTTTADPDREGPLPGDTPRLKGELVIDFIDGTPSTEVRAFNQQYGVEALYFSEHSLQSGLTVARVEESQMKDLLARLAQDDRIQSVSPNYVYSLLAQSIQGFPNDPLYEFQWHMDQVHAEQAWPWSDGSHAVVAVIDTGVAYREFGDRFHRAEDLDRTHFVPGYDFINRRTEAVDDHCHGTHVAGTVAQSTNNGKGVVGVAYGATIMPIKVLSRSGSGSSAGVASGIRFAADHGARVINLSLGGSHPDPTMAEAVSHAHSKGVVVICAAGNSGLEEPGYPAAYPESLAVSSTDYDENLAWYSNRGPNIDLAAPGGDTRHDKNGDGKPDGVLQNTILPGNPERTDYLWFQGTSMACPHVAGVAALIESLGVTEAAAVEHILKSTARAKGEEGYGAGIVDARAAAFQAGFVYGSWRLLIALGVAALAGLALLRRRDILGVILLAPGVFMGSSGLLYFFPLLGLNKTPLPFFLTAGFPSWDLALFGASLHGNPLMFSCLLPFLLALATIHNRLLRTVTAGFTAGVAGHLLFALFFGTVSLLWLPAGVSSLWLLGNALVCAFLAVLLAGDES